MAAIRDLSGAADKWVRRAGVAGEDYRKGVESPRTPWDTASAAAAGSYQTAVTAAAGRGAYAAGIRKAGSAKWSRNAIAKGPTRFAEGVGLATGEWQAGFGPYHQAISSLQLPARGPAGSPQNLQRVQVVAAALRALKDRTSGTAR